jgi:hypothetical protein
MISAMNCSAVPSGCSATCSWHCGWACGHAGRRVVAAAQAHAKYDDLVVRVFYLSHSDPTEISQVINTVMRIPTAAQPALFPNKTANSITIRATAAMIRRSSFPVGFTRVGRAFIRRAEPSANRLCYRRHPLVHGYEEPSATYQHEQRD